MIDPSLNTHAPRSGEVLPTPAWRSGFARASDIEFREPWGASVLLVALTGWGHPEDRARSEEAGFDHHLVKPVELAVLTELFAGHASRPTA